ncbi:cysteine proteinase [Gonapodya prolifera JEL478]|uniref:Cysteine proteinase n=1 Tax=Gonapodya prolifera (strain JEL478) TaxID=1344416 RepID=A0A139AIX5_GONPJ|nr:cysteine proteinase [Gonapodya prolifera JEL478]|eukprot:KXS16746.1 cysteine proteinase [Gonapodya prolifera JEL478]
MSLINALNAVLATSLSDSVKVDSVRTALNQQFFDSDEKTTTLLTYAEDLIRSDTRLNYQVADVVFSKVASFRPLVLWERYSSDNLDMMTTQFPTLIFIRLLVLAALAKRASAPSVAGKIPHIGGQLNRDQTRIQKIVRFAYPLKKSNPHLQELFLRVFVELPACRPDPEKLVEGIASFIMSTPITREDALPEPVADALALLQKELFSNPVLVPPSLLLLFNHLTRDAWCSPYTAALVASLPAAYTVAVGEFVGSSSTSTSPSTGVPASGTSPSASARMLARFLEWMRYPFAAGVGRWCVVVAEAMVRAGASVDLGGVAGGAVRKVLPLLPPVSSRPDASLVLDCFFRHALPSIADKEPKLADVLEAAVEECRKMSIHGRLDEDVRRLLRSAKYYTLAYPDTSASERLRDVFERIGRSMPDGTAEVLARQKEIWANSGIEVSTTANFTASPMIPAHPVPLGHPNLGNTCFLNASLQALFASRSFRDEVLTKFEEAPRRSVAGVKRDRDEEKEGSCTWALQRCWAVAACGRREGGVDPVEVLERLPEWLRSGEQQDCCEFLKFFFDRIEMDTRHPTLQSNPTSDPPPAPSPVATATPYTPPDLIRWFRGMSSTRTTCRGCGTVSVRKEAFLDLAVPIPTCEDSARPPAPHLADMLERMSCEEELKGDDMYHCDTCTGRREAIRVTRVSETPTYLIVALNRFAYSRELLKRVKIGLKVEYPIDLVLQVQPDGGDELQSMHYSLYAVIFHAGASAEHGHYYAFVREEDEGQGTRDDDGAVSASASGGTKDESGGGPSGSTKNESGGGGPTTRTTTPTWTELNDSAVKRNISTSHLLSAAKNHDTPYVFFYRRLDRDGADDVDDPENPVVLPARLLEYVKAADAERSRKRQVRFTDAARWRVNASKGHSSGSGGFDIHDRWRRDSGRDEDDEYGGGGGLGGGSYGGGWMGGGPRYVT